MIVSDLIAVMNQGRPKQVVTIPSEDGLVTKEIDTFDVKVGGIPYTVPLLRKEGRVFAGGKVVLKERLDALNSGDEKRIYAWGNCYLNLADLCLSFEDKVKFQLDSPLLTGIRGVVETQDGLFVAVDAEYVARAVKTKGMKHFEVRSSETVKYGLGDCQRSEIANNVVLLRYVTPDYIKLNADQFNSVNVKPLINTVDDFVRKKRIGKNGTVINIVWTIYPEELVIPLVEKTCEYIQRNYDSLHEKDMMSLLSSSILAERGEMRAVSLYPLSIDSPIGNDGGYHFINRVVGVASGCAAETEKR